MNGTVLNIQRFCTEDGPGIRTTVFLKGCPLRCVWCHNPEMHNPDCEQMKEPAETCGCEMTTEEVLSEVLKDRLFYENSGGGITLSGGEPFFQADFCLSLLREAKAYGLNTCVETCGYTSGTIIEQAIELVDVFLFDYKETCPTRHKKYTGVNNKLILGNLMLIDQCGKDIILRCPIIPTYNDTEDHFRGIAALANQCSHIVQIELEPYHDLGISKYKRLGRKYTLTDISPPGESIVQHWLKKIREYTNVPVEKA